MMRKAYALILFAVLSLIFSGCLKGTAMPSPTSIVSSAVPSLEPSAAPTSSGVPLIGQTPTATPHCTIFPDDYSCDQAIPILVGCPLPKCAISGEIEKVDDNTYNVSGVIVALDLQEVRLSTSDYRWGANVSIKNTNDYEVKLVSGGCITPLSGKARGSCIGWTVLTSETKYPPLVTTFVAPNSEIIGWFFLPTDATLTEYQATLVNLTMTVHGYDVGFEKNISNVKECTSDDVCGEKKACNNISYTCRDVMCKVDTDCNIYSRCNEYQCQNSPGCTVSSECNAGERCSDSRCVRVVDCSSGRCNDTHFSIENMKVLPADEQGLGYKRITATITAKTAFKGIFCAGWKESDSRMSTWMGCMEYTDSMSELAFNETVVPSAGSNVEFYIIRQNENPKLEYIFK